jgi:hypothetical protein
MDQEYYDDILLTVLMFCHWTTRPSLPFSLTRASFLWFVTVRWLPKALSVKIGDAIAFRDDGPD